ncbi:hypothetical protein D3C76_1425450 [compost metagenome]
MPLARHFGHQRIVMHACAHQAQALADEAGIFSGRAEGGMGAVAWVEQGVERTTGVVQHIVGGACGKRQLEGIAVVVARDVLAHFAVPLRVTR